MIGVGVAWLAIKQFLGGLSLRTWLIVGAVVAFGLWTWRVYEAGYSAADAKWIAIIEQERQDQEKAIREAGEEAWRVIDRLNTELEERNALIDKLNAEGDADPDADAGGITADSVRRINRSRKARSQ